MKKHTKTLKILMVLAAAVLFSLLCWLLVFLYWPVWGYGFGRDRSFTLQTKYVTRWMP